MLVDQKLQAQVEGVEIFVGQQFQGFVEVEYCER